VICTDPRDSKKTVKIKGKLKSIDKAEDLISDKSGSISTKVLASFYDNDT